MCREYKPACLNWCVSYYPFAMVNLIWFADDKFLKFHSCSQSDRIHMSVGIVWLSHVRARQCTSTQSFGDGWVSGLRNIRLQSPRCLVLTRWTLSPANQIKFTIEAGLQLTASVEPSKLVLTTHNNHRCKKTFFTFFILATFFNVFHFGQRFLFFKKRALKIPLKALWSTFGTT